MNNQRLSNGFTLIEILIVMVIVLLLLSLSFINIGKPQESTNLATVGDTLIADIKAQQILAMSGGKGSTTTAQPYGIYFQSNQYTLFAGSTYSGSDPNNFVETLPSGITLNTIFPSAQLILTKGAGEVQGFTAGSNTITLTTANGTRVITVGQFGAVTVN